MVSGIGSVQAVRSGGWSSFAGAQALRLAAVLIAGLLFLAGGASAQADLSIEVLESADPVIAGSGSANLTYTVTLRNAGPDTATDVRVEVLVRDLPGISSTLLTPSTGRIFGTRFWDVPSIGPGGSETIVAEVTVSSSAAPGTNVITGVAKVTATAVTDPDNTNDLVEFETSIVSAPDVCATKTASGTYIVGGTVVYTITITNNGGSTQTDNTGDEFVDVLPSTLTLVSATVVSGGGTVTTSGGDTVAWNGSVAAGASVILEITATIDASAAGGSVTNQGDLFVDKDGDGTNETMKTTDDPDEPGPSDPTTFNIPFSASGIPSLGVWGLLLFAGTLGWVALRFLPGQ
ncbi:MAG: hypothetical protein AAGK22_17605 [Acidobacteriota bacterium]